MGRNTTLGEALSPPPAKISILSRLLHVLFWPLLRKPNPKVSEPHSLLAHDRQGFMADLRLDAKTAVFDGSNIYHFGHDNNWGPMALFGLAQQLRAEGFRIICFFDANIFYTLQGHNVFPSGQRHHLDILMNTFGLHGNEIYVIPGGAQADRFVLNCLRHLPNSFAVTNDQFRDYRKSYGDVLKGTQRRKAVSVSKGQIKLAQHRLKRPVVYKTLKTT